MAFGQPLVFNTTEDKIITPASSSWVNIYKSSVDGLYYGKKSDGTSELIGRVSNSKTYIALLSQSGTNDPDIVSNHAAPTGSPLENSIGNIVWTRTGVGNYQGVLNGAFNFRKTSLQFQRPQSCNMYMEVADVNTVNIYTYDLSNTFADGLLNLTSISITTY